MEDFNWYEYIYGVKNCQGCKACKAKRGAGISLDNYEQCLKERMDNQCATQRYANAILEICRLKEFSLMELAKNVSQTVDEFNFGGKHEILGDSENRTWVDALRLFEEYVRCKVLAPQNTQSSESGRLAESIFAEIQDIRDEVRGLREMCGAGSCRKRKFFGKFCRKVLDKR